MIETLAIAGLAAAAGAAGFTAYKVTKSQSLTTNSRPQSFLYGLGMALMLFVWTAVTLPIAALVLTGGLVLALVVTPLILAVAGAAMLADWRVRSPEEPVTVN